MRVSVLGPLAVDGEENSTGLRDRVVLEALVAAGAGPVTTEQLADALWGDAAPASWAKVVQGCVMRLRRRLGPNVIETTSTGYRLALPGDDVDAVRFEAMVDRGREQLELGQPQRATHTLDTALALWRGRPFDDIDEWERGCLERRRLEELRYEAEELSVEAALRAGEPGSVLPIARVLAERESLRERRWALLARAEYQAGRQSDALRTLARARTILRERVGLEPGGELVELEAAILRHDPGLDVLAGETVDVGRCPFPGLAPFGVDDSEFFHGREEVVAGCIELLEREGVVAIVGPSGSGKSSVARAGIAARLTRADRRVRVVTPSTAGPGVPSFDEPDLDVLVVDQCEEAVMYGDPGRTAAFFDAVTEIAERLPIVIAIRADRLGEISDHPGLARLIERGLTLLGPMTAEELRAAIERPVRAAALLLESGLVDLLVREVEGEPGALPLLSHSLRATWERREGRVLTVAGYRETGGLRGAVAQTAEDLYRNLAGEQRLVIRDLLLRMVTPTAEGEAVRTPVMRRLMAGDREHERLIELLVDSRLVTTDGDTVELAHEALVRAWPRLRTWLDDDVEGQRILRHLSLAADGWSSMGRPASELYRGSRLRNAVEWRSRAEPALTPTEVAFLDESGRVAEQETAAAEERARHQAQLNRRLKTALIGAALLLVTTVTAGGIAVRSGRQAGLEAAAAERSAAASLVGLSRSSIDQDRSLALLLAVEAQARAGTDGTRGALLSGLFDARLRRTSVLTPAADYVGVAIDDGATVAVAKRGDGTLDVVDLATRRVRHAGLPSGPSPIEGVTVDPVGRFAASAGTGDEPTVVYNLASGEQVAAIEANGEYEFVAFSPRGDALAVADGRGIVTLYDVGTWSEQRSIDTGTGEPLSTIAFDTTGELVFVVTLPTGLGAEGPDSTGTEASDGTDITRSAHIVALDTATGTVVAGPIDSGEELISSIAIRAGNTEMILAGVRLQRRTVDDLALIGEPFGFTELDGLVSLAVAPNGTLLAGSPIELQVYDLDRPESEGPALLDTIEVGAPGLAVTNGGRRLVTADVDGTVSTWTLVAKTDVGTVIAPGGPGQVTLTPDGAVLVVWGEEGGRIHDSDTLALRARLGLEPGRVIAGVDVDGGSGRVVTLSCPIDPDRCVADLEVWSLETGRRLAGPAPVGDVWRWIRKGVAFARGDAAIVVPLLNGEVGFWDSSTLEALPDRLRLADHTALAGLQAWGIDAVDVGDRSLVAAQDEVGQSATWDVSTPGSPVLVGALENAFRMQFAPDGRLVTSSGRGGLTIRDPFTLEPIGPVLPGTIPAVSYSFSDNGLMLASGDHGAELYDLVAGRVLSEPLPAKLSAISPDGSMLYLGAGLGFDVISLSIGPSDLVQVACRQAGRNLSTDEWNRLIGSGVDYRPSCAQWPDENFS